MRRAIRLAAACGLAALTLGVLAAPRGASAHEVRQVGDYEFVVGFRNEPAFVGEQNGIDLYVNLKPGGATRIASPAAGDLQPEAIEEEGTPVEGLEETLQAEIIYLDQTLALPLSPRYNEPGAYDSVVFPTEPGDYSFRVFGAVEGVAIDETFTSGPETFGAVQDPAPLQFPQPASGSTGVTTAGVAGGFGGDPLAGIGLAVAGGAAGLWSARGRIGALAARRARTDA